MMKNVVVTGAAGYIGGEIALRLKDAGHRVVGIDLRDYPKHLAGTFDRFVRNDFASNAGLNTLIQERPDAVIHCAGTSLVGPSMSNPSEYYNNNVVKTLKMLDILVSALPNTRVSFNCRQHRVKLMGWGKFPVGENTKIRLVRLQKSRTRQTIGGSYKQMEKSLDDRG